MLESATYHFVSVREFHTFHLMDDLVNTLCKYSILKGILVARGLWVDRGLAIRAINICFSDASLDVATS